MKEWQWMCEHWYWFLIGVAIIGIMLFIGGCMRTSSIASRAEEDIYNQNDVEHGDKKEGRF